MKRLYRTEFHAAHHIEGHPKCGQTHGHSYQLQVEVDFPEEVWVDFADIKQVVEECIEPYDHVDIGDYNVERLAQTLRVKIQNWIRPRIMTAMSASVHPYELLGEESITVDVELWETSHFGVRT